MKPNLKALVAQRYSAIADVYLACFSSSVVREAWLTELVAALSSKSRQS